MAATPGAPVALITGGSIGIGYELARCCARDGWRLVLVARHEDALRGAAQRLDAEFGAQTVIVPVDLAQPHAAERIVQALAQHQLSVELLVNNAGFGAHGGFQDVPLEAQLQMVQVNVTSVTELTHRLLPTMLAQRRGRILNVASTAAFQPGPLMAVYYATKAYVLSLSEALSNELAGTGVTVTALCPGPTATEFQRRAGIEHLPLLRAGVMSAARVAVEGYRAALAGRRLVIPGQRNRLLVWMVKWSPRALVLRIVRRLQERRRHTL